MPAVGYIAAGGGNYFDGDVGTFTIGDIVGVSGGVINVTGTFIPGSNKCIIVGPKAVIVLNDTWDSVGEYVRDPDDPCSTECVLQQTDASFRDTVAGDDCTATGGTVGPIGFTDPESAYGSNATTTILNNVSKKTEGNGCVTAPGVSPSINVVGDVDELLSEEDTEEDAIARSMVCTDYGPTEACTPEEGGTAFITPRTTDTTFGFRQCQVRGTASDLIVGHNYTMTIGIYNRTYGSGGPFLPDTIIEISFTAESVDETTDWQDVPNTPGFETRAMTCHVVDSTGP